MGLREPWAGSLIGETAMVKYLNSRCFEWEGVGEDQRRMFGHSSKQNKMKDLKKNFV
jgi:hypothetical protein